MRRLLTPASTLVGIVLATLLALLTMPLTLPTAQADAGWGTDPPAASQSATQGCAQVLFVGVRGSGEQPPYGATVTSVRDALAAAARADVRVRQVYLDYPAAQLETLDNASLERILLTPAGPDSSYFASVTAGVNLLTATIADSASRCPDERVLLVGFSQGAEVITRTLAAHPLGSRLLAAVLIGNPSHYDGQNVQELDGSAGNRAYGLSSALYLMRTQADASGSTDRTVQVTSLLRTTFAMVNGEVDSAALASAMKSNGSAISATDAPRVYSVCQAGDLVCDSATALTEVLAGQASIDQERSTAGAVHGSYAPTGMPKTLAAVTGAIAALPHVAQPSPPAPLGQTPGQLPWLPIGVGAVVALAVLGIMIPRGRHHRHPEHPSSEDIAHQGPSDPWINA